MGAGALVGARAPHRESVYVNFLMDEGEDRVRAAYGGERTTG